MRSILFAAGLIAALPGAARADQRFEATFAGHAILPAASFVAPPAGALPGFATSGRFTGPGNLRVEPRGSMPADTGPAYGRRATGLSLPFEGQLVQDGQQPPACFPSPARFKRIYLVDLQDTVAEGFVRKIGHIDLMAIRDPQRLARTQGDRAPGAPAGSFAFPFFTIENVAVVDADHIIVANDNNLPFSAGRFLTRADANEFILLRVPELLRGH
jgi:hypothetical protein